MPKPIPQPAGQPHRARISKVTESHLAAARQVPAVEVPQNTNEPAAAQQPVPQSEPAQTLVPFSTRIPTDLRERYEWLKFATRTSVQQLVIEALTKYADEHQQQQQTDRP